jgi:hypothetical protein
MNLQENEKALIMGTLLGDAHLQKRKNSYRLKIEHSIAQREYVLWKYKELARLCQTTQPPKEVTSKRGHTTVVFYTSSGSYLEEIYSLFYKPVPGAESPSDRFNKMITPELIAALPLNPLVLVAWFLDDGSIRDDAYSGKIATQGFTKNESLLLKDYLQQWGIDSQVVAHSVANNQYYISLPARTFSKLIDEIEPIVSSEISSMDYKLNKARKPRNDLGKVN